MILLYGDAFWVMIWSVIVSLKRIFEAVLSYLEPRLRWRNLEIPIGKFSIVDSVGYEIHLLSMRLRCYI